MPKAHYALDFKIKYAEKQNKNNWKIEWLCMELIPSNY